MFIHKLILSAAIVLLPAVSGCGRAADDEGPKRESAETVIRIEVTETGFYPSDIELAPGATAVLEFVRTAEQTCATAVVFPESGIRHELPLNEPVRVTVRPQTGRQIVFACPMDMYMGSFRTAGAESAAKEASIGEAGGVLEIRVDEQGFHPSRIRVTAGQPSVLRFTRVAENTCSTGVLIPALGIDEEFPLNVPIDVTISPGAIGEISFSCPTKMSTGVIEVVGGDER